MTSRKPASRTLAATRRQALRVAMRALMVAEEVLRAEQVEDPERIPPQPETRGAELRFVERRTA